MTEPTEQELISKAMSAIAKRPRPSRKKYFSEAEEKAGTARRVKEFRERKSKQTAKNSQLWELLCRAIDEGEISIIHENADSSIDGGVIVTDIDTVIEHIQDRPTD